MNGKVLFACSKCFSRHQFEELSSGQQLCKECRGNVFPLGKCSYCRSEFQQSSKNSNSSICKKCEHSLKQYGKPSACECCNIIAAFSGPKCHRCANSELKYGPPVGCEQCKQRCAFDKHDDNKKIDGKLLCWLCTLSYKRALVKARQVEKETRMLKKRSHNEKNNKDSSSRKVHRTDISKQSQQDHSDKVSRSLNNVTVGNNITTAVVANVSKEGNSSDHVVAMTQLKEVIAGLQKRLTLKDKELLEKDKLITELKGKNFENENDMRNKMRDSERLYEMKIDLLNKKVTNLLKEVAGLKKSVKKNGLTTNNATSSIIKESTKDSGGSGTDSPLTN